MELLADHKGQVKVKGVHTLSVCDARSDEAKRLSDFIEVNAAHRRFLLSLAQKGKDVSDKLHRLWGEYRFLVDQLHRYKVREVCIENMTMTVGRAVFARRLAGNTTYTGIVNYTALGSSSTAVALGDTQLGTEVYRKALSSGTYLNNIAYLETFFTAAETSGTYQEYGNFIDGTGAANSGQLFNRFLQAVTKSAVETLNVQSTITISDA